MFYVQLTYRIMSLLHILMCNAMVVIIRYTEFYLFTAVRRTFVMCVARFAVCFFARTVLYFNPFGDLNRKGNFVRLIHLVHPLHQEFRVHTIRVRSMRELYLSR